MLYRDNNIDRISNKESMRRSHRGNGWDMKMYDQGRTNIKIVSRYIDRCFGRSIGKNFDKVKKHIYDKMRHHITSRYDSNLIENLLPVWIGEGCKYILDRQNRIQLNKEYIERVKLYRDYKLSDKLTILDPNIENTYRIRQDITDREIEKMRGMLIKNGSYVGDKFNHIVNGGILPASKYREFIESINEDGKIKNRWAYGGYDYIYDTRKYIESCFVMSEENVVHVFDANSSEYRQYKKERQDKKHKEQREYKRQKDEYNESLLYCIEYNRKRKEEEKNNIDRDRLGFDENSFIGEGYHGQQRKKK